MNKMRLAYLSVLLLTVLFLQAAPVSAHAPAAIGLDYDFGTQVLTVDVSHGTTDPDNHYIIQIIVEKNSVEFMTKDYTSQPSTTSITDTFDVPAVDGDVLSVTAFCNLAGQHTESITVSDPSSTTTTTTTTTSTTTTTTTTSSETTTDGTTTSPTPPFGMDSTLVIFAIGAVAVVIILVIVYVKRV